MLVALDRADLTFPLRFPVTFRRKIVPVLQNTVAELAIT